MKKEFLFNVYLFYNMRKLFYLFLIFGVMILTSCGEDDTPPSGKPLGITINSIEAVVGSVSKKATVNVAEKTVSVPAFDARTDLSSVTINFGLPEGVTVTPASGAQHDFSSFEHEKPFAERNEKPVKFTVTDGNEQVELSVSIGFTSDATFLFVADFDDAGSITEPDMKLAWESLKGKLGDHLGYASYKSLTSSALKYIDVVAIYQDNDTVNNISEAIPAKGRAPFTEEKKSVSIADTLKAFHAKGGHFFLAGHGTQYLNQLGRISADEYLPKKYTGDKTDTTTIMDNWGINNNLNVKSVTTTSTTNWDRSSHALWNEIDTTTIRKPVSGDVSATKYDRPIIPLNGPGFKESHVSMWDLESIKSATSNTGDNFAFADMFETTLMCKILATRDTVNNLRYAAAVEFLPRTSSSNEGTIIAIGARSYEFEQPGDNPFIDNVAKVGVNAIKYMYNKEQSN